MDERTQFYHNVVREIIRDKNSSVLVCGGGSLDKDIFVGLAFKDVTISNLDSRMSENQFHPFGWKQENTESLSFDSESFDYVVVHASLHHTFSPHKALTEMYRVAKKGILVLEARDSLTMRLMEKFGLTQTYESTAVYCGNFTEGGVNNTEIPNYVYRWTEREVEKTIRSYAPYCDPKIIYRYGTAFPCTAELEVRGQLKVAFLTMVRPIYWLFTKVFPKQQNLFAFYVEKSAMADSRFPWLEFDENEKRFKFNRKWGERKFKKKDESQIVV